MLQVVHNEEEFKTAYYYGSHNFTANELPTEYPCVVEFVHHDGGIGGPYVEHVLHYACAYHIPSFIAGIKSARRTE